MKVYELQEGKEYQDEYNAKYKIINGYLNCYNALQGKYETCCYPYNEVVDMNFTEVVRVPDENTPIDTLVRVRNVESDEWIFPIRLALYLPSAYYKFACFSIDKSSKNSKGGIYQWKYCEII